MKWNSHYSSLLVDVGRSVNLTKDNIVVQKIQNNLERNQKQNIHTADDTNKTQQKSKLPPVPMTHAENSAYHQPTIAKLMAYLNATIGSLPVKNPLYIMPWTING